MIGKTYTVTNKPFLFLLAWIAGSPTAEENDADTKVHKQEDLLTQLKAGNEEIYSLVIWAPNVDIAEAIGYKEAFFDDYTAHDALSTVTEIIGDDIDNYVNIPRRRVTSHGVVSNEDDA